MSRPIFRAAAAVCLLAMAGSNISAVGGGRLLKLRVTRARAAVPVDTNFDGRYDEQDFYDRGVLVRRELDRNLDNRIDLVEVFDRLTHERVRVVVDTDFDGRADRLLLYSGGRPVYSEILPSSGGDIGRQTHRKLEPLFDPSGRDAALVLPQTALAPEDAVTLIESAATLNSDINASTGVAQIRATIPTTQRLDSLSLSPRSPRGPPPVRFYAVDFLA